MSYGSPDGDKLKKQQREKEVAERAKKVADEKPKTHTPDKNKKGKGDE